jgi:hypothetical protein
MTKKEYRRQYRQAHKAELKQYRILNRKRINELQKIYIKNHREQRLLTQKRYRERHKDYNKEYYKVHKEEFRLKGLIRYKKLKVEILKKHKEYMRQRRKKDILFRIMQNLRTRVNSAIFGFYKSTNTLKLIGCSKKFLKLYLESKFDKSMSWDNYGLHGWHIDHIKPCASFDLSKKSEQRKCFHYTNLQPLWAEENLMKSGNYDK